MSNNKISYLNRTFDDYKQSLYEYIAQYYPQIASDLNDASVGSWLIDMVAAVSDNRSYYIDKAYNETNLDSAKQRNSVYSIARSNGLRVPGPKGSVALCEFSCDLPVSGSNNGMPNYNYAPLIKRGTKVGSRSQVFEVMNDINFAEEFDYNGFPNRQVLPVMDSNGKIIRYHIVKSEVVSAGESKIYKQVLNSQSDVRPFMEVVIPDTGVMGVESIIFKDGVDYQQDPFMSDFMTEFESSEVRGERTWRFFEVDSLADAYRWGDGVTDDGHGYSVPVTYRYNDGSGVDTYCITKGEWKPVEQKFITEFTDKGYLKVIFGAGEAVDYSAELSTGLPFAAYQISKIVKNNCLGRLPKPGTTMYILYRTGGGAASNVAANTITQIIYLNAVIGCNGGNLPASEISAVRSSIAVTNKYPSVTGKDAPTVDEIKAMIKYNNSAQNRCVTVKDYENRVMLMPPRYGSPFRVCATEENNKIMLYMLGINSNGTLSDALPEQLTKNIAEYLSKFRMINDFVEMKSGKIINLSIEADIYIDKNYVAEDVISEVIGVIKDFMDINKHRLGETIYVSMLMKDISNVSGVLNLMDLRIFNEFGENDGYSGSRSIDPTVVDSEYVSANENRAQIDIDTTGYLLNSDSDAMFEIKNPSKDIRIRSMMR